MADIVKDQIFSALDRVPTLVGIAGGLKGDELKKKIEAGKLQTGLGHHGDEGRKAYQPWRASDPVIGV